MKAEGVYEVHLLGRFNTGAGWVICVIFISRTEATGIPVAMIQLRLKVWLAWDPALFSFADERNFSCFLPPMLLK